MPYADVYNIADMCYMLRPSASLSLAAARVLNRAELRGDVPRS